MLPREQRDALLSRIASLDKQIRLTAISEAGALSYDGGSLASALMQRLTDADKEVAKAAEDALVRIGPGSLPAISLYFFDQHCKWEVIGVMERLVKETLERLSKFRSGATAEVVARIDAVMRHAEPAVPELLQAMSRGSAELMGLASAALTRLGAVAVPVLAAEIAADRYDESSADDEWRISNPAALAAAAVLSKIGHPAKDPMLEGIRMKRRSQIRHDFEAGLAALGDEVTS